MPLPGRRVRAKQTNHGPYFCSECPEKRYITKCGLTQHINVKHLGKRPYKCHFCPKTFPTSTKMKTHRIIHTDEKTHRCEICDKIFLRLDQLKCHTSRIHLKLKPFVCGKCDRSFTQNKKLKEHSQLHEREQLKCDFCPALLLTLRDKQQHHNLVHPARYCEACDVWCISRMQMSNHCKTKTHAIKQMVFNMKDE